MKITCLILMALTLLLRPLSAQNYYYKTYTWDKQPKAYTAGDKTQDFFKVKEKTVFEVAYESDGAAVLYETHHLILHLNSEKALDKVNKVYIPTSNIYDEVDLKARCITRDDKVIPFNKENVKKVENLEDMGAFTIFTVDGVEAGCDVEYMYTLKKKIYYNAMFDVENRVPVADYEFRIISPRNLVYEAKSYNGLSAFVKDKTDSLKNVIVLNEKNVAAFEEEKYSTGEAEKKCFLLQLNYNTDKGNFRLYTWETMAKSYYEGLYAFEKAEQKAVDKLLGKQKFAKEDSEEKKIRALESFMKTNFLISNDFDELPLDKSIDEKKISEGNALRVYIAALKSMQIPFELVFTCDRTDRKFDAKFPSYAYTGDVLFYFPNVGKYTSPLSLYYRLGYQDQDNLSSEGLFIKEVTMGEMSTATSKVKALPANDYKGSFHNMVVKAMPDLDNNQMKVEVKHLINGYSAQYYQPVYRYYDNDQKKEFEKGFYMVENAESVKNFTVTNYNEEDVYAKPFVISYTQDTPELLENAGNKYILKVGDLIGEQSELYQESKRRSEGDIIFTHYLQRDIEVVIPAGYKVSNPEDVVISKKCLIDGKDAAQFVSTYKIEGNKMLISVYEDYRALKYPLANFEDFKAVINAAADFNKKTLLFEKL